MDAPLKPLEQALAAQESFGVVRVVAATPVHGVAHGCALIPSLSLPKFFVKAKFVAFDPIREVLLAMQWRDSETTNVYQMGG